MSLENLAVFYSPRSQSFCLNTDRNDAKAIPVIKPKGFGIRHLIALLGFWGFSMAYAIRFNLAIAIIVMAKPPPLTKELSLEAVLVEPEIFPVATTSDNSVDLDKLNDDSSTSRPLEVCSSEGIVIKPFRSSTAGEFDWDEEEQGIILASFFWGYVITQVPGGFVATKFGGKWILGIGMFINGVLTVLIPVAARSNIYMLIYVRFIQGLAQGVIFPAMQAILANWSPVDERSSLSAIAYSGCSFGAAATMVCSGYILDSDAGWPFVFYTTGGVTILWAAFWFFLVSDKPSEDRKISLAEQDYIVGSLGPQNLSNVNSSPPWKKILTSVPVWTIAFSQFGHDWVIFTLLTGLPSYLNTVLMFDMEQNSWLTACPHITQWLFSNLITIVADKVIVKGWLKTGTTRKLCHGLAEFGPALALVGVIAVNCNRAVIVSFLAIAVTLSGASCASHLPNQLEIAPNYAGMIMGFTNTVGNIAGFGTALTIGALTKNDPSRTNWMYVFAIAVAICCINAVIYIIFSSSDEQSWNKSSQEDSPEIKISEQEADDVILCELNPREINDKKGDDYDYFCK